MTDKTTKALLFAIALGLGLTTLNTWPGYNHHYWLTPLSLAEATHTQNTEKMLTEIHQVVVAQGAALEGDINGAAEELNKRIAAHGCR